MSRNQLSQHLLLLLALLFVLIFTSCFLMPGLSTLFSYLTTLFATVAGIGIISFGLLKLHEAHRYDY